MAQTQRSPWREQAEPAQHRPASDLAFAVFGAIVWAAHFSSLYLIQSWLCTVGGDGSVVRWLGVALTFVAMAALLWFTLRHRHAIDLGSPSARAGSSPTRFAGMLAALSMLAVVWAAVPLVFLPACSSHVGG